MEYDGFESSDDGVEISDDGWKKVVHRKRKPATMDVEDESNLKAEETKNEIDPCHLAAFLADSTDTERMKAIYPLMTDLARADKPAVKQITQQIFAFTLKLADEEGNSVLAMEATSIAIWCLTINFDCCNHWDNVYNDNPEASVALFRRLVFEWTSHCLCLLSSPPSDTRTLYRTMKSFTLKNQKHITEGGPNASLYIEADKYSKEITRRLSLEFRRSLPTDSESESENEEESESESENEEESESESENEEDSESESENENIEELSLAEAVTKIHRSHLVAFLRYPSVWFRGGELICFTVFFWNRLSGVPSAVHFPWPKYDKLTDVINPPPISRIHRGVFKTAADWIKQLPTDTVSDFILWSFDDIRPRVTGILPPPKTYVPLCVALAIILRSKPFEFLKILPRLKMEPYQAVDTLPVTVWMMAQVSQVDLCLGLYSWAYNLLPLVGNKHYRSPQSMDLILQLVESILSDPDARTILLTGSVKKGDARLISPPSFEILLRLTFPDFKWVRVNDTKRFEAIYPLLKELALADAPGRKSMKQLTQQIFTLSLKLAGEGMSDKRNLGLAKEAKSIALWCVTKNVDCCNLWDQVYNKNLEASVALLKKLVYEWKDHSHKLSPSDTLTLKRTMKSFILKNKKGITKKGAIRSLYNDADLYSKEILGRLSPVSYFLKGIAISAVLLYLKADRYSKANLWKLSRASGFLKGIAIIAVLLVAAVAVARVVLSSNLVGSFGPHKCINAITTAL